MSLASRMEALERHFPGVALVFEVEELEDDQARGRAYFSDPNGRSAIVKGAAFIAHDDVFEGPSLELSVWQLVRVVLVG